MISACSVHCGLGLNLAAHEFRMLLGNLKAFDGKQASAGVQFKTQASGVDGFEGFWAMELEVLNRRTQGTKGGTLSGDLGI